ncbi:hypothetical protein F5Y17DRAFT_451014 [Xylariaceae sp. FL0594]|nr:hypothetical protein F5Y17DRAFT_451014 [Xylariaceae sp. FL0594]
MTNLGPLPTTFALPPQCSRSLEDIYKIYTLFPNWYYLLQGSVEQTICYPGGYTAGTSQFYSPAFCPTGFTAACQSLNPIGTDVETIVTCCPTHALLTCRKSITYVWESTLGCQNAQIRSTSVTCTVNQVTDGVTAQTTYTTYPGGVNAYSIQVRHRATDFMSSTSTSTSSSSSSSTSTSSSSLLISSTSPTQPSSLPAMNSTNPSDNEPAWDNSSSVRLTPGAAAGIAIGAFAGLLLLIVLIWTLMRRRSKRVTSKPSTPVHEIETSERASELGHHHQSVAKFPMMGTYAQSAEMDADHVRYI